MGSSQSAQTSEDEERNNQRESLRLIGISVSSSSEEVVPRENAGSSDELHLSAIDMANVEEVLKELLQGSQSLSDNDDEETSEKDTVKEMNFDTLIDHLFGLSRRVSRLRSGGNNPEELMRRGKSSFERFEESGAVEEIHEAIECWRSVLSISSNSDAVRRAVLNNLGCAYLSRFERLGELVDLRHAIECGAAVVSLTPDGHADKPGYLNNLGNSYRARFGRLGEVKDLNKAVECAAEAVSLTPDGHTVKPRRLNNLGLSYLTRFGRLGEMADLNKAIECGAEAVMLTPDGHAEKPGCLNNLGNSYQARFEWFGEAADLNKAVECAAEAVSLTPDGHAGKPGYLSNLGLSYRTRFERLGEVTDLNKAIQCGAEAVTLTPDGHADKPVYLDNLGHAYRTRLERLGEVKDLNKAIECGAEAVSLTPDDHAVKPSRLNNLGNSYLTRFGRLGEVADLNKAIECGAEAVLLTPEGHAYKPGCLSNLGMSFLTRFGRLGEVTDMNKAIEYGAEAVLLTPDGHAGKPGYLSNLGNSYQARFGQLGGVKDLNKAVECAAEAVMLTPDGHAVKPGYLNNLGLSYLTRFERLGEVTDLNQAIECGAEAVSLTPDGHADKPAYLDNLGHAYQARFGQLGEAKDLNKAIECGAEAVLLTPNDHAVKPSRLNNLGLSYLSRFGGLGEVADLNKAIECGAEAVLLTPGGHADKPGYLNNLGLSYLTRFERLGEVTDLNQAIECGAEAVSLTPDSHAGKPVYLRNLGESYRSRFSQTRTPPDLDSAIAAYRAAALSLVGRPSTMLQACFSWARLASSNGSFSPYPAYLRAMDLLPQFVWIGNTLGRRYCLVEQLGDFATEAAAFAISIGNLELALEWLEAGRSIIWGQAAQLRTPFELLSSKDRELANRLKEVSSQLENSESRFSVASPPEVNATDLSIAASGHIQLALEWDTLLQEARSIPGFENFLKPPKFNLLLGAAKFNPIAIINVHESRCDALILQPNCSSISHVPLTELSVTGVMNARKNLVSQARQRKVGRLDSIGSLERSLHDLWFSVLHPILDFLGYTPNFSMEQLPRLTWCTTGLLSFLPLHAAGCYDGTQDNAMDRVISSYTPNLSALLAQRSDTSHTPCGVLAVSQEHTPGLERLPGTKDELVMIKKHAHRDCYLQLDNEEATVEQVLEALDHFSWVHMACHGSQDTTDPTQSAFHLHDGKLTLADISKKSFTNKGLAFLSACQTATGDKTLPEEAIHLAAGMLMAGFPSVIGTMWSIADEDGPKIADKVYASLLKDGKMDHTNAARALHEAVVGLRAAVGERSFERWAPFIHIGC